MSACGGGGDTPGPTDVDGKTQTAEPGGTGCAGTIELVLMADRAPVDATFVARGGGAYVDANGDFHVIFGDRTFGLADQPPEDLVTISVLVPLAGAEPQETTYTSADDGANLDVTRRDDQGSISTSFGSQGTGDKISLEVTELGGGVLCATITAASNPAAQTSLHLNGTIEVPYGDFEDLV